MILIFFLIVYLLCPTHIISIEGMNDEAIQNINSLMHNDSNTLYLPKLEINGDITAKKLITNKTQLDSGIIHSSSDLLITGNKQMKIYSRGGIVIGKNNGGNGNLIVEGTFSAGELKTNGLNFPKTLTYHPLIKKSPMDLAISHATGKNMYTSSPVAARSIKIRMIREFASPATSTTGQDPESALLFTVDDSKNGLIINRDGSAFRYDGVEKQEELG